MFDITVGPKQDPKIIRLTKNTDWDKFKHILANSPINNQNHGMINTSKIDETVEMINLTFQYMLAPLALLTRGLLEISERILTLRSLCTRSREARLRRAITQCACCI